MMNFALLTKIAAAVTGLAIFVETLIAVSDSGDALQSPASVADAFGSPATIGRLFLTDHLLAFEITSIVLLVAAVGGVILGAHSRRDDAGGPVT